MTKELRTNMISAAGEDKQCLLLCGVCLAVCSIGPSKFDIVRIHRQCHINRMFHRQTVPYQPDVPPANSVISTRCSKQRRSRCREARRKELV